MRARVVVNATGVWADDVRALDEGTHPASMEPAKGVHITVPWSRVRNDVAAILPVPGDRRSVFVIPWGEHTYVGTTDTAYDGSLDEPRCTDADVAYLLARAQRGHDRRRHRRRRGRDVGGSATAAARRRQGSHRRPVPASRRAHVAERRGDGDRREAHHLPPHGGRRGRRRGATAPGQGGTESHPPSPAGRRRGHRPAAGNARLHRGAPSRTPSTNTSRTATARDASVVAELGRHAPVGDGAARPRSSLSPRRGGLRGTTRDGSQPRRRVGAPHTGTHPRSDAQPSRAAPAVGALLAPELGWSEAATADQVGRFVTAAGADQW